MKGRMTGGLLLTVVVALGLAGPAQAVRFPGTSFPKPWDLRVKASGAIDISWKIESGLKGSCTDWSYESGSDTMILGQPDKAGKGVYSYGMLSGQGRTTGIATRNLAAQGGSSLDEGCRGVCPKASGASASVFDPIARAADCVLAAPYKAPDISGCSPGVRKLISPSYNLGAGSPGAGLVPRRVRLKFTGAPKKPFFPCGNPPILAAERADITVLVPLLPKLKKGGMVFGESKGKGRCSKDYPKNDGFTKTTCIIEWDVKTSIFRAG